MYVYIFKLKEMETAEMCDIMIFLSWPIDSLISVIKIFRNKLWCFYLLKQSIEYIYINANNEYNSLIYKKAFCLYKKNKYFL